jgi:hypothetical protein
MSLTSTSSQPKDAYHDPRRAKREDIVMLAGRKPFTGDEESRLIGYVREALREFL